jgi:ribosomal subunit interface protein
MEEFMKHTISVRHCEVSDEVRARAEAVLDRAAHNSPHALEGAIVFDQGPKQAVVELRLHVRGGHVLVAIAEADDHRTALDRAEEKLRRQLDRATGARQSRRSSPRA